VIVTDLDVPWIAACGLDCGTCDIRLAPTDSQAARRLVAWFQEMGWLEEQEGIAEAVERGMYCKGCRGDRSTHWSAEWPDSQQKNHQPVHTSERIPEVTRLQRTQPAAEATMPSRKQPFRLAARPGSSGSSADPWLSRLVPKEGQEI
jgi:hypothetical protein